MTLVDISWGQFFKGQCSNFFKMSVEEIEKSNLSSKLEFKKNEKIKLTIT